ncbi:hypothetical protein RUND412_006114 [Rhizina undulata]
MASASTRNNVRSIRYDYQTGEPASGVGVTLPLTVSSNGGARLLVGGNIRGQDSGRRVAQNSARSSSPAGLQAPAIDAGQHLVAEGSREMSTRRRLGLYPRDDPLTEPTSDTEASTSIEEHVEVPAENSLEARYARRRRARDARSNNPRQPTSRLEIMSIEEVTNPRVSRSNPEDSRRQESARRNQEGSGRSNRQRHRNIFSDSGLENPLIDFVWYRGLEIGAQSRERSGPSEEPRAEVGASGSIRNASVDTRQQISLGQETVESRVEPSAPQSNRQERVGRRRHARDGRSNPRGMTEGIFSTEDYSGPRVGGAGSNTPAEDEEEGQVMFTIEEYGNLDDWDIQPPEISPESRAAFNAMAEEEGEDGEEEELLITGGIDVDGLTSGRLGSGDHQTRERSGRLDPPEEEADDDDDMMITDEIELIGEADDLNDPLNPLPWRGAREEEEQADGIRLIGGFTDNDNRVPQPPAVPSDTAPGPNLGETASMDVSAPQVEQQRVSWNRESRAQRDSTPTNDTRERTSANEAEADSTQGERRRHNSNAESSINSRASTVSNESSTQETPADGARRHLVLERNTEGRNVRRRVEPSPRHSALLGESTSNSGANVSLAGISTDLSERRWVSPDNDFAQYEFRPSPGPSERADVRRRLEQSVRNNIRARESANAMATPLLSDRVGRRWVPVDSDIDYDSITGLPPFGWRAVTGAEQGAGNTGGGDHMLTLDEFLRESNSPSTGLGRELQILRNRRRAGGALSSLQADETPFDVERFLAQHNNGRTRVIGVMQGRSSADRGDGPEVDLERGSIYRNPTTAPTAPTASMASTTPASPPAQSGQDSFETLVGQIRRIGELQDFMLSTVDSTASQLEGAASAGTGDPVLAATNTDRSAVASSLRVREARLRAMQTRIDLLSSEFALLRNTRRELRRVEAEALETLQSADDVSASLSASLLLNLIPGSGGAAEREIPPPPPMPQGENPDCPPTLTGGRSFLRRRRTMATTEWAGGGGDGSGRMTEVERNRLFLEVVMKLQAERLPQ